MARKNVYPYGIDDPGLKVERAARNEMLVKEGELTIDDLAIRVHELQKMVGAFASVLSSSHEYRISTLEAINGIATPTAVATEAQDATAAIADVASQVTSLAGQMSSLITAVALLPQYLEADGPPETNSATDSMPNGSEYKDRLNKQRYKKTEGSWIQLAS